MAGRLPLNSSKNSESHFKTYASCRKHNICLRVHLKFPQPHRVFVHTLVATMFSRYCCKHSPTSAKKAVPTAPAAVSTGKITLEGYDFIPSAETICFDLLSTIYMLWKVFITNIKEQVLVYFLHLALTLGPCTNLNIPASKQPTTDSCCNMFWVFSCIILLHKWMCHLKRK